MSPVDWFRPDWAPIPGHPGYEASAGGKIRSTKRRVPREIAQRLDRDGYLRVNLSSGRHVTARVNRLVLLAFVGAPPEGKPLACHGDGVRTNNALSNLAWGSNSDNMADRRAHGTDPLGARTSCGRGHEYTAANTRWRKPKGAGVPTRICRACERERQIARRAAA